MKIVALFKPGGCNLNLTGKYEVQCRMIAHCTSLKEIIIYRSMCSCLIFPKCSSVCLLESIVMRNKEAVSGSLTKIFS